MRRCGPPLTLTLALVLCVALTSARPPPQQQEQHPDPKEGGTADSQDDPQHTGLAYDRYLRQVVETLESDPEFRKKLENADVADIKSGKIAQYLEMVNHTVRSSLDEIKRQEVTRLQELARLQMQQMSGQLPGDRKRIDIPTHLDVKNPHSFEMKDLEHLIKKTTNDLEEMDKKRKEEFKEYEMEKEFEKQEHLKKMNEEERKKEEARLEELKKKHADHPKINHPGSKDQFEEVWEKSDHLEDQEFNPKTFFYKHDLNGDMEWSVDEVEAVLQLELDKMYDSKNPEEDDPREREEEMAKMREHVFGEMDTNHNWRISFQEFIDYTGKQGEKEEFKKDDGWKTVDEEQQFNDQEYQEYLRKHHPNAGQMPPHPNDLQFQPEHQQQLNQQQQQQQFAQQQAQFQQQQQQQFHQQQQQFAQQQQQMQQQQMHQQQQQFQQPPVPQQQFNAPPGGQPMGGQPPAQPDAAQVHPDILKQQSPEDQEKMKQQLKELQEKLAAQQQLQQQQQQQPGQQQQQQQQQQHQQQAAQQQQPHVVNSP